MATANSDIELLTEHFGYPPVSLLDDIINSVNILAERALDSVEKALLSQSPSTLGFRKPQSSSSAQNATIPTPEEAHRHEVENGTHQLETLLCAAIDRNFDTFELYVLRNILCVKPEDRDWIRLAHYEGLNFSNTPPEGGAEPSVQSVNALRRRLQASQSLNCMLHGERARNEALLAELRALVGKGGGVKAEEGGGGGGAFAFLKDTRGLSEGDAETPLTTTAAFTLSQLQALRALSTSLRNMMPDLVDGRGDPNLAVDTEGRKGWRRERLEYVEAATRKHLENYRGLELGEGGEVRDGEWQAEGRNLAKGEVEGLEKVVTILGGGPESSSKANEMDES